jgi:hypothetical protein
MYSVQGHCHGGESTCQVRVQVFSSKQIPYSILLLLVSHPIFDLSAPRVLLCPHSHLSFAFSAAHFLVILHIFSLFLEPPKPLKNTVFLLPVFTQSLTFIHCSRFLSHLSPPTVYYGHILLPLLYGNEWLIWSVALVNTSWNMSRRAWVHELAWCNTLATCCGHSRN